MARRQRPTGPFRARPSVSSRPAPGRLRPPTRPRPRGYTAPGFRSLWDLALPGVRGRERREFFNRTAMSAAASAGLVGAMGGAAAMGPVGSVIGLAGGLWLGGLAIERHRMYRP